MFNYLYKLMHGESSLEKTMREARDKIAETEKLTDKQIMSDIKHSRYMLELEQKSLGPSVQFDKINEEFKNVIETRLERLNNAKTFIANANKKLEELGVLGCFKSYKKGKFYYQIAFMGGHFNDPIQRQCLRGRMSDEDDIKIFKDFYEPIANYDKYIPQMQPFIKKRLQDIIGFSEFLPDFYCHCLESLQEK